MKKEEVVLKKIDSTIEGLKEELILLIQEGSAHYKDINKNIAILKKHAIWEGKEILLAVIDEVAEHFEERKNGLPVK